MKSLFRAAVLVAAVLMAAVATAQVHGVPPSVTSMGTPGKGMAPGVPASVTSLGPRGWNLQGPDNCCSFPTPLIPSAMGYRNPAFNPDGKAYHLRVPRWSFGMPVYVPYAIYPYYPYYPVYETETEQYAQPVAQEPEPPAPTIFERRPTRAVEQPRPAPSQQTQVSEAPEKPEPPTPQEPTLLIFKDGRRVEILNFAIVGDTVYELSPEYHKIPLSELNLPATIKENDARGTDFHIPGKKIG